LKEAGLYVIYKAHPESYAETRKVIAEYSDEFSTEDFSGAYYKADCLLFPHPGTTTFGYSLMTNMPMVVFCENIDKWHPELLALLKKRCVILPMTTDNKSKVVFDKTQLIESIMLSPKHLDHSVVAEFALK
jgi:hypothetical protein